MAFFRRAGVFGIAVSLGVACGGTKTIPADSGASDHEAGAHPVEAGFANQCGATISCNGSFGYQRCTTDTGRCYVRTTLGAQSTCSDCAHCPEVDPCGDAGNDGGTLPGDGGGHADAGDAGAAMPQDAALSDADIACSTNTDTKTCQACCEGIHTAGAGTFIQAEGVCLCESPGACVMQCTGNYCLGNEQPTEACQVCVDSALGSPTAPCTGPVSTACSKDPNCIAFARCTSGCT